MAILQIAIYAFAIFIKVAELASARMFYVGLQPDMPTFA